MRNYIIILTYFKKKSSQFRDWQLMADNEVKLNFCVLKTTKTIKISSTIYTTLMSILIKVFELFLITSSINTRAY